MKRPIFLLMIYLISVDLISQDINLISGKFTVITNGLITSVTSRDMSIPVRLVKPTTVPVTSEPESWKIINSSSGEKILGGVEGQVHKIIYETNLGLMDCETWISSGKDMVAFRQTFTNRSKRPVRLNSIYPIYINGKDSFSFGAVKDWKVLEQFRHKNDLPKTGIPLPGKSVSCDPFLVINNNKGIGKNLFIGYQTFYLHLADITISFDQECQIDHITANCDFEGVVVPPDGTRTSQWIILTHGDDACRLIDDYTERIREFYDQDIPPGNAPSVYCTWYYHADNYNEEIFKQDIAQFRKEHLPFDVFLIDECWDMNDWGDFEANSSFPDGMKWVASQINSLGYTAGIWSAPFLVDGESTLANEHPAWLLKNSKGMNCIFNMNNRDHFILDLTFPGVCEYLEEQFRKISQDWGYEYFKFDFMRSVFIDTDQQFHDRSSTSLEAYREGLEAIRRGTGKDAYISVCGGHFGASYGLANTQRSGSDVKSQWNNSELPKYRQNILRTWMSGLWHVDPDAMMVRRQLTQEPADNRGLTTGLFTDEEAFTNAVNQFIGGNLITFTEDFSKIDKDRRMLYRHVIPSVNSSSRPLDIFNTEYPEIMLTRIRPVCKKLEDWNMISIVNWTDEIKTYDILIDDRFTGNLKGDRFLIFDFKSQQITAWLSKGGKLKIESVPGHQSRLLKIVAWEGDYPMFIGTDLNFSCGGLEVSDINFSNDRVSGWIETEWNVPVKLSFVTPVLEGYKLKQLIIESGQKRFLTDL